MIHPDHAENIYMLEKVGACHVLMQPTMTLGRQSGGNVMSSSKQVHYHVQR